MFASSPFPPFLIINYFHMVTWTSSTSLLQLYIDASRSKKGTDVANKIAMKDKLFTMDQMTSEDQCQHVYDI